MALLCQHAVSGADLGGGATLVKAERGVVIGFRALQFPESLCGLGGDGVLARGQNLFIRRQQVRAFEQAAEIFFAGGLHGAFLGG
jgi:hypothetical protein